MSIQINEKLLEKIATAHLYEVMGNKSRYLEPDNFSTVQYMNTRIHIDLLKFKELVVRSLASLDKGEKTFLNMGCAAGHLEFVNRLIPAARHKKYRINLSSVEWVDQYDCCKKLREMFKVDIHYICNDVLSEDFEIYNCKTYFDYVVLERFFPIYRSNSEKRIQLILKKFVPYAKDAIIVESKDNLNENQRAYLKKVSRKMLNISGPWDCYVIDLENFNEDI